VLGTRQGRVCQTNDEEKVFGVQEYLGHFGDPQRRHDGQEMENEHGSAVAADAIAAGAADRSERNDGTGFGTAAVVVVAVAADAAAVAVVVRNGEQAWAANPDDGAHEESDERRSLWSRWGNSRRFDLDLVYC